MRYLALMICMVLALPATLFGQTVYTVPLTRTILPDTGQYHGSKVLTFVQPAAGTVTVPPQWSYVATAVVVDQPQVQSVIMARFRDANGRESYAVANDGRGVFDSTSVLRFHSIGNRMFADFPIIVKPGARGDGRHLAGKIELSKNRVIARLAECRDGTLRLGNQDYRLRIYAPSVGDPFFDVSAKSICLIDLNRDGAYSWRWQMNESDRTVTPSERITMDEPFRVGDHKLRATSIDPEGTAFACSDYSSDTAAVVGFQAPAFSAADLAGRTLSLADLKNRVVLLMFWSTTCPYCEEVRPDLDALVSRCDTTQFQAVCTAADRDSSTIADFLRTQPYGGIIVPYAPRLWNTYDAHRTTPVYYVIDRDGSVAFTGKGSAAFSIVEQVITDKLSLGR